MTYVAHMRLIEHMLQAPRKRLATWRRSSIQDPFLDWLLFANAGMLVPGNVAAIRYALARIPSNTAIVEIGAFAGLSANVLGHIRDALCPHINISNCDPWSFEGAESPQSQIGTSTVTYQEYRDYVRSTYIQNVRRFSSRLPITVEATSIEFFDMWRAGADVDTVFGETASLGGSIGFCYIDGDHTYEAAKQDFLNCSDFLISGGFILFDDSSWTSNFGCRRAALEAAKTRNFKRIRSGPNVLLRRI